MYIVLPEKEREGEKKVCSADREAGGEALRPTEIGLAEL